MRINVTAGDYLNQILSEKYPEEAFIPFREAMIEGPCSFAPFSNAFLEERAAFHCCSLDEYKTHMSLFLKLLEHLRDYSEIVLWFGVEPFCKKNAEVVIEVLKQCGFQGSIVLKTVVEETGSVVQIKNL